MNPALIDGLSLALASVDELSFALSNLSSLFSAPGLDEPLFALANLWVLPFWGLMILAPGARLTGRAVRSPLPALLPALGYVALALPEISTLLPAVMRPELGAIAALLSTPRGAAVAWMHFLAFDLLVGRAIYLEARRLGAPWWVSSPVLFFTLMLGPVGLLLGLLAQAALRRREGR